MTEQEERRHALNQALASTRIEGHAPSLEFLADCERFVRGEITPEDVRRASLERALATELEKKE